MTDLATKQQAASLKQHQATAPQKSVWVSANAGTGKTRVLTNRLLRLMVEGAAPSEILALTYTRAAAAEMRGRVYGAAQAWPYSDQQELGDALKAIGIASPTQAHLTRARTLFAQLVDAAAVLRIGTIHSFCQSVLRRFPFEARVNPYFRVMEEAQASLLQNQAMLAVMQDSSPQTAESLHHLAVVHDEGQITKLLHTLAQYPRLLALAAKHPTEMKRILFAGLDCEAAADHPTAAIAHSKAELVALPKADEARLHHLVAAWHEYGSPSEGAKKAKPLADWLQKDQTARQADPLPYVRIFMTGDGGPRQRVATKQVLAELTWLGEFANQQYTRAHGILATINAIETASNTAHLINLASLAYSHYGQLKSEAGMMDYDDLVLKTAGLLADDGAAWVRYKLDQGIKYILLDESQDTSGSQWRLLSCLIQDQWADSNSAIQPPRSVFSVGDYKQSIYSFQGARPELFRKKAGEIEEGCHIHRQPFTRVDLTHCFRSTQPILDMIDHTIGSSGKLGELTGIGKSPQHISARSDSDGWVRLAPLKDNDGVEAEADDGNGRAAEDGKAETPSSENIMLDHAKYITQAVHSLIGKCYLPSRRRLAEPGDILLLHRSRDDFYHTLRRQLQQSGLLLAASDRIQAAQDICGLDLLALADVIRLPHDDLQLAALLKSPLFGISDDQLYHLARGRGSASLWQQLAKNPVGDKAVATAKEKLDGYMDLGRTHSVHAFYSAILDAATKQGFAQRLGASVLDVISEFLDCARRYEANNTASLTGFAHFMRTSDGSNKREQQDHSEASSLRMLTVHGAKGLQSPIVILPDACRRRTPHNPLAVIDSGEGIGDIPLLAATPFASGVRAEKLEEAREVAKQAEANEDNRLLYVAMTRAEDGLYIAGFSKSHSRFLEDSWYGRLKEAMFAANADKTETGELLYGAMPTAMPSKPATAAKPAPPAIKIPPWVATNPPPSPAAKPRLVPSRLGDVLADTNEDPPPTPPLFIADAGSKKNRVALSRGNLVHRLFEVLPKLATTARMDAARRLIANMTQDNTLDLSESDKTALIQEVMAVMGLAELAPLFAEGSLAEMPISGHIGSYSVTGSIDRLAIGDDSIRFVDFKTDMTPPTNADKISQKYIDQIAAYAHLLSHIWADRPIAAGIVYTATPAVFWLDNAVLAAAIAPLLNK